MNWILLTLAWPLAALMSPIPHTGNPPVVTWLTETNHDFGEIRAGSSARFVFKFQNARSETIVLQTVRTTCGCTAAEWTEEPIAAGANGSVTIEFDADRGGAFRKKITVFFDKQRKPEVLWITGDVVAP